jgi:uncharacterized protein (TIGR00369 family)
MSVMSIADLYRFLAEDFPQITSDRLAIERLDQTSIRISRPVTEADLRPGGTVSGPTLMGLADVTTYLLLLSRIGPVGLAVTTNLNITFLRKPSLGGVAAEGQLLKLGSRLAVVDVRLFSEGDTEPVAQATVTYSIPPRR